MYSLNRVADPRYLAEVRKFVAAARSHRESLNRTTIICPCSHCKNNLGHPDMMVQSHLIRFGFVKDYTVWTFHGERANDVSGKADGGQSSSTTTTAVPVNPAPPAGSENDGVHDYITVEDVFQSMAGDHANNAGGNDVVGDDDGGVDDPEVSVVSEPGDVKLFEQLLNHIDEDDTLFGNARWLENLREMKQAAVHPLYPDCPKECTELRFNLHMLMMKARHGWSDTSFDELLAYLATTYPASNKVPANIYRAKKLIRPVAMKVKKFDVCPNHCILY